MAFVLVMHRSCDCAGKVQGHEFQDGPLQAGENHRKISGVLLSKIEYVLLQQERC